MSEISITKVFLEIPFSHIKFAKENKLVWSKEEKKIFEGMIPKLDNAFAALQNGVSKVIIGKAEAIHQLISGTSGTSIIQ